MFKISLEEAISGLKDLDRDLPYLETLNARLGAVRHHISTEGMSREVAEYLHGVDDQMLPGYLPPASFTAIPSKTNLTQSLEAIDLKRGAIIGAIIIAVATMIAKFFSWLSGSDDSGHSGGGGGVVAKVADLAAETEDKTKKIEATIASIDKKIEESDDPKASREQVNEDIAKLIRGDEYGDISSEVTDELMDGRSKMYVVMHVLMTKSLPALYELADQFAEVVIAISKEVKKEEDFDESKLQIMSKLQSELVNAVGGSAEALKYFEHIGVKPDEDVGGILPESMHHTCIRVVEGIRRVHTTTKSKYERKFVLEFFKSELAGQAMPDLIREWTELTRRRQTHLDTLANMDDLVAKMPDGAKYGAGGGDKARSYEIMRLVTKGIIGSISGLYSIMFELASLHLKHLAHIHYLLKHIDAEYDTQHDLKGERK
jgi:hypothetical protein